MNAEESRKSIDHNKSTSKLSFSLNLPPSGTSLMAVAEREARGSLRPMVRMPGSHFSDRCEDSTRTLSWSDGKLDSVAAQERRCVHLYYFVLLFSLLTTCCLISCYNPESSKCTCYYLCVV